MVGHSKFCLTLLGGFVVFHESPQLLQIIGMLTTLSGKYTRRRICELRTLTSSWGGGGGGGWEGSGTSTGFPRALENHKKKIPCMEKSWNLKKT